MAEPLESSRLLLRPSRVSPPSSARYARRAMRQFSKQGARGLAEAAKLAAGLEATGQTGIKSAESRVAEDALNLRYDEQLLREQEAALSGEEAPETATPTTTTKDTGFPSTLGETNSLKAAYQRLKPPAPFDMNRELEARLPDPAPGVKAPPENKVTGSTAPRISDTGFRINPLTGKPFGHIPAAGRDADASLADYQKKYLGGGDISTALRESSARNAAEAARLGRPSTTTTPVATIPAEYSTPVDVPAPTPPLAIPELPASPPAPPQASAPYRAGQLARNLGTAALSDASAGVGRVLQRPIRGSNKILAAGVGLNQRAAQEGLGMLRAPGATLGVAQSGVSALLDRARRARLAFQEGLSR